MVILETTLLSSFENVLRSFSTLLEDILLDIGVN